MSANRDKNQKYGFFYQNLYQIYKSAQGAEAIAEPEAGPAVLKVGERAPAVESHREDPTFQSLRDNLARLTELHSKLRFMLEELEELSKKE